MISLDSIDLSILENVQKKGRITNIELSGIAKISAPPCLRRLKSMEKKGIILGYHAKIDPIKIGYRFKGVVAVRLLSQYSKDVISFINNVSKLDNVRSCFSTPGDEEFILTIIAKDLQDYEDIIQNNIQTDKNVISIKTYIIINKYKDEFGIPIPWIDL